MKHYAELFLLVLVILNAASSAPAQNPADAIHCPVFRNTDPSVGYVGSKACIVPGCHEDIGRSYFNTSHGTSMAPANSQAELARVPQPIEVFNQKSNRHYVVYQKEGGLYQSVYEVDRRGRKIYEASHKIDYVVGGENTGYSYLFRVGRWIFQSPLSFYVPTNTWELSPGYAADDAGFDRLMTTGCLVCHNGQPDPEPKRDGMYKEPPFRFNELAISCESCHGPGALHVREMQTHGDRKLALNDVDTSIVNPAKLAPRLADDICRECHQAGDAVVLNPGKGYMDYRPGTALTGTMNIVKRPLTEKERAEANRLEAQPPVRGSLEQPLWWKNSTLELSRCYRESDGRLTCSTCHSIHHAPLPANEKAAYRAACLSCHTETSCTLKPDDSKRVAAGDYCVQCHMEKRPIAGIAHSSDTKHRIVRYPGQPLPDVAFEQPKADLPGLLWLNRPSANVVFPNDAQLEAYWTVARKDQELRSLWLKKLNELNKTERDDPLVLNYLGAVALAEKKDYVAAADDFERALKLGSEEPRTYLNLATALEALGRPQDAELVLERGTAAFPYSGALVARLALRCAVDGNSWRAQAVVAQFRKLFPEDPVVRDALRQIDSLDRNAGQAQPDRSSSFAIPR